MAISFRDQAGRLRSKAIWDWIDEVDRDPAPVWLVNGWLPADATIIISGEPTRAYKTWFAFALCGAIASGRDISLIQPTNREGAGVLFIELEGPRKSTADRWRWLSNGHGIGREEVSKFHIIHRENFALDSRADIEDVSLLVAQHDIKLVVIDTFAQAHRGDENSSRDVTIAMNAIKDIKNSGQGTSVAFLHHLTKPSKDSSVDMDHKIRGSSALAGAYDVHQHFYKEAAKQRYLNLTIRANDFPEQYFTVQWAIDGAAQTARLIMKPQEEGELTAVQIESYVSHLVPMKLYSRPQLKTVWGLSSPGYTKEVIDQLLAAGVIEVKDKRIILTDKGD